MKWCDPPSVRWKIRTRRLNFSFLPRLPQVWADRIRVGQVLTNLVSNAHKYTPEGGKILVGAEATNNQWDPEGANALSISG